MWVSTIFLSEITVLSLGDSEITIPKSILKDWIKLWIDFE